jgi:hypothetical protein
MDRQDSTRRDGAKEFLAKYGASLIALGRFAYDVAKDWFDQHGR